MADCSAISRRSPVVSDGSLKATEETGRVPGVNAGLDDIFGNNGAGSDHDLIADRHREDRSVCSDTDTIAKFGRTPELRFFSRPTGDEHIINKHGAMRNEAVVSNCNELTDK